MGRDTTIRLASPTSTGDILSDFLRKSPLEIGQSASEWKPVGELGRPVGFADLWKRSPSGDRVERADRTDVGT
jgi:hypothetical protein